MLDLGCGDGTILEQLVQDGHNLHGYDLADVAPARRRLAPFFGAEASNRIRTAPDERTIPFDSNSFDVVISNQVFEHVKFFDPIMAECARVLEAGGVLLTIFPLATYPVEWHLKVPLAHWIPPGPTRVRYLLPFYAAGLRPRLPGASALGTAVSQDEFLRNRTYYRFINEVVAVGRHHFGSCAIETDQVIRAKVDLLETSAGVRRRIVGSVLRRAEGPLLSALATYLYNAAFCFVGPTKAEYSRAIVSASVATSNFG